jgi:adenylosuccinate lyase
MSISCLDTRYYNDVKSLVNIIDEFAYYRNRILVELKYFSKLTSIQLQYNPLIDFKQEDFLKIMDIEKVTRHDVKAIEYFIKEILEIVKTEKKHLIHVGLTSQDACSIGFMLCFIQGVYVLLEQFNVMQKMFQYRLIDLDTSNIIMLGLTHGQPATPTHWKKEMLFYNTRFTSLLKELHNTIKNEMTVKFGGATGEFNAMKFTCPDIDWNHWCDEFVQLFSCDSYKLSRTKYTNQCDHYDATIKVLYIIKRILHVMEHLRGNLWLYIHREYLVQENIKGEIGSSTMPNKINPIDLENAKTAIEMAKRMIDGICDILTETSYQRDVSDSSALRNISSIFGYILIATKKITNGISRLSINTKKINEELEQHPEVILEGIQTYLKFHCGFENSYELTKDLSRGKNIEMLDITNFIDSLDIDIYNKQKLKKLNIFIY